LKQIDETSTKQNKTTLEVRKPSADKLAKNKKNYLQKGRPKTTQGGARTDGGGKLNIMEQAKVK
jgi:hypothetical protein